MSGKFPNKFAVSFLALFLCFLPIYSQQEQSVNGYINSDNNPNFNKALRLQGIGDFFFNKGAYAQAVPYYEEALELLPKDADIPFKLAQIYQRERLWRLAVLYYESTISLLKEQENFGKSQLNSYISRIRLIEIEQSQNNRAEARKLLTEIQREKSLLRGMYPQAFEELEKLENSISNS